MAKWRLFLMIVLGRMVCLFGDITFPCKSGQIHWKPNTTSEDQYKCLECPSCFEGLQPSVPCGSSVAYNTPVHCIPCQPSKTYSDGYGKEQCKACRVCSPGKAIKKNCTVSSNTLCDDKCLPGYYKVPFIFGCHPCTECCNDEKDEVAGDCANSEKKCKVRSTPCSRELKPSTTSETVKVATTLPTTYKKPIITSDPTQLESKVEKHTSTVSPPWSGNNTNGDDNSTLIIVCTVCAVIATIGIIALVASKICRGRINADTYLCQWNRISHDKRAEDVSKLETLKSPSQEQLYQDDMTLSELQEINQKLFDQMCLMLDNGRQSVSRDYERLAACYKGISLEERNALQSEHDGSRSPSKMLMNHLQTKYPSLPMRHFVRTLKEIGRNDLVEKLKPYVKKNVNSSPA